jgi:ATP-dependent Clp protease protease subunit
MVDKMRTSSLIPMVIEQSEKGERSFDIFSRMLRDRIIFFHDEVNDVTASVLIAQLLLLESESPKKDITIYINSPGGSISAGLAIFDTMEHIKCDVRTIGMGTCASMGAFLLAAGTPGKRMALPNAEVMIHQPLGGSKGQASDMEIAWKQMEKTRDKMNRLMAGFAGKTAEEFSKDSDRDNWMSSSEALAYGLIDEVLGKSK